MSNCCPDTGNITSLELKTPIDLITLNFQPNRCTIIKSDFEGLYAVIKKEEYDRLKKISGGDGNGGGNIPKCSNSSNLLWQIGFFSFLIIALILLVLFLVYFFKNKTCYSNKLK